MEFLTTADYVTLVRACNTANGVEIARHAERLQEFDVIEYQIQSGRVSFYRGSGDSKTELKLAGTCGFTIISIGSVSPFASNTFPDDGEGFVGFLAAIGGLGAIRLEEKGNPNSRVVRYVLRRFPLAFDIEAERVKEQTRKTLAAQRAVYV